MTSRSTTHSDREFLRHTVATLAYRAEKALRDVPSTFPEMRASPSSRTPLEILIHMGDLIAWGERMVRGDRTWAHEPSRDWAEAHARFFDGLAALDRTLAEIDLEPDAAGRVFSGPVADALTHTGQISFLRGIAGSAVRPENYARAEVRIGHVGPDQPTQRAEYDGDASRPRPEG